MPATPVITNTFRVALLWAIGEGATAVNVMHFLDTLGTQSESDLRDALLASGDANMWACVSNGASFASLTVQRLNGVSAALEFPTSGDPWSEGQNPSNPIPAVAQVAKFTTGLIGRSNRGRIFIPFVAEGVQDGGIIDPAAVAFAQAAWDNFLGSMAVDNFPLTVASYLHATEHVVETVLVEGVAATQRRRQSRLR